MSRGVQGGGFFAAVAGAVVVAPGSLPPAARGRARARRSRTSARWPRLDITGTQLHPPPSKQIRGVMTQRGPRRWDAASLTAMPPLLVMNRSLQLAMHDSVHSSVVCGRAPRLRLVGYRRRATTLRATLTTTYPCRDPTKCNPWCVASSEVSISIHPNPQFHHRTVLWRLGSICPSFKMSQKRISKCPDWENY